MIFKRDKAVHRDEERPGTVWVGKGSERACDGPSERAQGKWCLRAGPNCG